MLEMDGVRKQMDKEEVRKLRQAQLLIANEIKRICDKHNITCFLDAGSLLGAVRHKGFIPWDDDLDLGMMPDDYRKFVKIAPGELSGEFFLDNYETNRENALVFSKVRLLGTEYIENKGYASGEHNEIFVDVFPYYYISDNRLVRKTEGLIMAFLAQAIMSKSGYQVWKGEGLLKRLKFIPSDLAGMVFPKKMMHSWVNHLTSRHYGTQFLCENGGSCYGYWYMPKAVFQQFREAEFEGQYFRIPEDYDTYLTRVYGDYMKLPPENERVTHQIIRLDFGNRL